MADPGFYRLCSANPKGEGANLLFWAFSPQNCTKLKIFVNLSVSVFVVIVISMKTELGAHISGWVQKCGRFGRVIWTMGIGYIHYSSDFVYTHRQHHRFCERHYWSFSRTLWRPEWMYNPFYLSKVSATIDTMLNSDFGGHSDVTCKGTFRVVITLCDQRGDRFTTCKLALEERGANPF